LLKNNKSFAEFAKSIGQDTQVLSAISEYLDFTNRNKILKKALILCGFPKLGNTWLRLIYQHLIYVGTNAKFNTTLTYTQLNNLQPNNDFPYALTRGDFREPLEKQQGQFPVLFHSHAIADNSWKSFGNIAFVYRNPLDALLSIWYATVEFVAETRGYISVNTIVLDRLDGWCNMWKRIANWQIVLSNTKTQRSNPNIVISGALKNWSVDFTTNNLDHAISLSDFTSIRRMEESSGEYHGHRELNPMLKYEQLTPWVTKPNVRFTRSRKTGQWEKELKSSTVNQAITLMKNQGINPIGWGIQ